jgi:hypothetical protein
MAIPAEKLPARSNKKDHPFHASGKIYDVGELGLRLTITTPDRLNNGGDFNKSYPVELLAGRNYLIELRHSDNALNNVENSFGFRLMVTDKRGVELARGGNRLRFQPRGTGVFQIIAMSQGKRKGLDRTFFGGPAYVHLGGAVMLTVRKQ